jgi:GTPase SAR1 family protein
MHDQTKLTLTTLPQLWDTAGQERFRCDISSLHCHILVTDIPL